MIARCPILLVSSVAVLAGLVGCASPGGFKAGSSGKEQPMTYEVQRVSEPIRIDGNWDKPAWQAIKPLSLTYYMGEKPEHLPVTQVRLAYDAQAVYVIFRVEDQYVRAVAAKHQDPVCRDSCVEFFFTPGTDVKKGYFNLEMNCGGIMLLHFQTVPRRGTPIAPADIDRIQVRTSLPRTVDPERVGPTIWTAEYRLPLDVLATYMPEAVKPAPGVTWRANFFKCADHTSHPHWLTWSFVDRPRPDFHVPECFGTLEFK
ncbi:MAG TPA: carbohydrate-binding family 9-like protein [Phycisphaerae bacterium]|nr:carbohydrate-binding family 9-like protein [Phycisphaerae bacterium]